MGSYWIYKNESRDAETKRKAAGVPDPYPDWQEAGKACLRLGIGGNAQYIRRRHEDPRLPLDPARFYGKNFPGWRKFVGPSDLPKNS